MTVYDLEGPIYPPFCEVDLVDKSPETTEEVGFRVVLSDPFTVEVDAHFCYPVEVSSKRYDFGGGMRVDEKEFRIETCRFQGSFAYPPSGRTTRPRLKDFVVDCMAKVAARAIESRGKSETATKRPVFFLAGGMRQKAIVRESPSEPGFWSNHRGRQFPDTREFSGW